MDKLILIKYGELTTKKDNRKFFIKELVNNIRKKIDDIEIEYSLDRMYIKSNNTDDTISKLKEVFGIYSIIECYKVNTNIDEIKDTILNLLKNRIKFVGTGTVRVKGDIIIFTHNSNAILTSLIKRKDIAVTENNIQAMAKCLMF